MSRTIHEQAMEMQTGACIAKLIVQVDDNSIAFCGCNLWNGPLVVDAHNGAFEGTIWVCSNPCDVEIVSNSSGVRYKSERQKEKTSNEEVRE